jgi:hypothetical protein
MPRAGSPPLSLSEIPDGRSTVRTLPRNSRAASSRWTTPAFAGGGPWASKLGSPTTEFGSGDASGSVRDASNIFVIKDFSSDPVLVSFLQLMYEYQRFVPRTKPIVTIYVHPHRPRDR